MTSSHRSGGAAARVALATASLLVTLALWAVFSWPLPQSLFTGVPYTAHRGEGVPRQVMVAGDHLQLLYHFWLASDMLAGHTQPFYNPYEFNTGSDEERYAPGSYYVPFSLFYAFGAWLGGRAFGWNFAGFLSLWLGYGLMWALTRRYSTDRWTAAVAALPALCLPFCWHSLLGGSPAGFALMWVPAILLGLDIAVRDGLIRGGVLSGLSVLFASFGDTHVFFFSVLIIPAWCVVACGNVRNIRWEHWREHLLRIVSLGLAATGVGLALLVRHLTSLRFEESTVRGGRPIAEVMGLSPRWPGLFSWDHQAFSSLIYVGGFVLSLIVLGGLVLLWRIDRRRSSSWRPACILALCICLGAGIALLALGPRGPWEGRLFLKARKLIPPYAMIRQTAKIFCLMPSLLSVGLALSLTALVSLRTAKKWKWGVLAGAALLIAADYSARIRAGLCMLDNAQAAYQAVAKDAAAREMVPRALIVTLWPGDTHFTSQYEYYCSLYRIRMVNGYAPIIEKRYIDEVFQRFKSVNQGHLNESQLAELRGKGIRYVLFHTDTFPEKVSPFPPAFTLHNLLNNPRLHALGHSGAVWAFRILAATEARAPYAGTWTTWFPARRWEAEKSVHKESAVNPDPSASAQAFVRLSAGKGLIAWEGVNVAPAPKLRYMLRVRGKAEIATQWSVETKAGTSASERVDAADWAWVDFVAPPTTEFAKIVPTMTVVDGALDVDCALVTAGDWTWDPQPGTTCVLPAPCFFTCGDLDVDDDQVTFTHRFGPGAVLYGPQLPLAKGRYDIAFDFASPAPPGTALGELHFNRGENEEIGTISLVAGAPAVFHLSQTSNLPFHLVLVRGAPFDLKVKSVSVTRLE